MAARIIRFPQLASAPPPSHRPIGHRCQALVKPGLLRRRCQCRRPATGRWAGRDLCTTHFREEVTR